MSNRQPKQRDLYKRVVMHKTSGITYNIGKRWGVGCYKNGMTLFHYYTEQAANDALKEIAYLWANPNQWEHYADKPYVKLVDYSQIIDEYGNLREGFVDVIDEQNPHKQMVKMPKPPIERNKPSKNFLQKILGWLGL